MTKRKGLILCLVVAALMLLAGAAVASEVDPIVCSMELDPNKLAAPGTVNVTITISNSGNTDMKDPVVLYDPRGADRVRFRHQWRGAAQGGGKRHLDRYL